MLYIIGLGLDKGDISSKGLEAICKADTVFWEEYTLPLSQDYIRYIESRTGKKCVKLKRTDLEDGIKSLLKPAQDHTMAILVPGDPLIATTHHLVLETAQKMGIKAEVYHAPSIFSAGIAESGLDIYKFGPTTTIPFWSEKYKPTSFLDVIKKNLENKEHTLVLLDVNSVKNKTMSAEEAIETIRKAGVQKGKDLFSGRKVLFLFDIGCKGRVILYLDMTNSKTKELLRKHEGKRTALIVPAEMSFAEQEIVESLSS